MVLLTVSKQQSKKAKLELLFNMITHILLLLFIINQKLVEAISWVSDKYRTGHLFL